MNLYVSATKSELSRDCHWQGEKALPAVHSERRRGLVFVEWGAIKVSSTNR